MSATDLLWLGVAAVLALISGYSFLFAVAHLFVKNGGKHAAQSFAISVVAFTLWNGWNWLMGR